MIAEWEILLRLVLSGILAIFIGIERTRRNKDAGVRTHCIIAVAAATMMMISRYAFVNDGVNYDPARIAAQIITGISFVGAGVIFRDGNSLKGLSTAAGIWATAGVGMAIGCGMYILGVACAALVVLVQIVFHKILIGSDAFQDNEFIIRYKESGKEDVDELIKSLKEKKLVHVSRIAYNRNEKGDVIYTCSMTYKSGFDIEQLMEKLSKKKYIISTEFK